MSTDSGIPAPPVDLDNFLRRHGPSLIDFRRDLHRNPELSMQESATTEKIYDWLRANGLAPQVLKVGTGLICDIGNPAAGPTIALRADIDALAMNDLTDSAYTSRFPGVAHACGHDVHTSTVLGAGLALQALDEIGRLQGRVRLIFEPGEETVPGGAVYVMEEGWLDSVEAIFGLHCDPKTRVGQLGTRVGPITSASDTVEIILSGPGGHTARPERTVDLVRVAARIIDQLPARFSDLAAGIGETRLVFGAVHSGNAHNVIPSSAVLRGTIRTPSRELWSSAPALLNRAIADVVADSGATWELSENRGIPPVLNSREPTVVMERAARLALGAESVVPTEQSWGGDSFGWYLEQVPGTYARLGTHGIAGEGPLLDLHASTFDVDERCINVGVRVLVNTALLWLEEHAEI